MSRLFIIALFFFKALHGIQSPELIFVFGSSCAGKSSLATALSEQLEGNWEKLDWDEIADNIGDEHATECLFKHIDALQQLGINVIVDSQTCVAFHETFQKYQALRVLVYAPPATLIQRDEVRGRTSNRLAKRNLYARSYIYNSFAQLFWWNGGYEFTDLSASDLVENPFHYDLSEEAADFFGRLLDCGGPGPLACKISVDVIIHSDRNTPKESAIKVCNARLRLLRAQVALSYPD